MQETIDKLLKATPGAKPAFFEASPWFDSESLTHIKKVIKTYEKHYERRLKELIGILGEPVQTERTHRQEIYKWYPEAIRAACWLVKSKTLCLALEQHDRETPVCVLLRCRTPDEIAELSADD